jgi:hypothetical protein
MLSNEIGNNLTFNGFCRFKLSLNSGVNWKYAITTFVVLRYAITIREIGYMP